MGATVSFTITPVSAADAMILGAAAAFHGYPNPAALVEALIQQTVKGYQQQNYTPPGINFTVT